MGLPLEKGIVAHEGDRLRATVVAATNQLWDIFAGDAPELLQASGLR
jgi:hypothetical protein